MSDVRRKSFTGPSKRRPLHRSSSESNFTKNSDVSLNQSQDFNSSPDISLEEKVGDATRSVDYIPESVSFTSEDLRDIREGSEEPYTSHKSNSLRERQYSNDEVDDYSDDSSKFTASIADEDDGSYIDKSHDLEESHNIKNRKKEIDNQNEASNAKQNCYPFVITASLLLVSIIIKFCATTEVAKSVNIETIKANFPTQDEELWLSFESGVNDVVTRDRPSTFIFLYEEEAEELLGNLTEDLSKYAACSITDCAKDPIKLTDAELNSPEVVRNFGSLVDKYRNELEERGVMIINNLQNVYGTSAQVFHTFCDEFTPLVEKSLFIFTMKVDQLPEYSKRMQFVEQYFKNKWNDVKIDTLNALITRITSMVLEVHM